MEIGRIGGGDTLTGKGPRNVDRLICGMLRVDSTWGAKFKDLPTNKRRRKRQKTPNHYQGKLAWTLG